MASSPKDLGVQGPSRIWDPTFIIRLGIGCLFAGVVITAIDMIFPHQFSTILEVDYDTPYDRHVIIEESFDTRNIRRRLPKVEDSFGDRIIRFRLKSICRCCSLIRMHSFLVPTVSANYRRSCRADTTPKKTLRVL